MRSCGRVVGLGFLAWLLLFVVAFISFPLRQSARPVFESIMAVAVAGAAVGLGLIYFRPVHVATVRKGIEVGFVWLAICILIDAPLMLLGGPMHMSIGAYLGDIGLTYVVIPIVTCGLGAARASHAHVAAERGIAG